MTISYSQIQILLGLIDDKIGYLEDNGYRYKMSGDIKTYEYHQGQIEILKTLKKAIEKWMIYQQQQC